MEMMLVLFCFGIAKHCINCHNNCVLREHGYFRNVYGSSVIIVAFP